MEDCSSINTFLNLHLHRHRPPFHLTRPGLQSPEVDYLTSQHAPDSLQQYGSKGEALTSPFPHSSASSGGRRGNNRVVLNSNGSCLDDDGVMAGENGLGCRFDDFWYGGCKKEEAWDDEESCENAADDFYSKVDSYSNANDVFYSRDCGSEDGVAHGVRASYPLAGCDVKSETAYIREPHHAKQTTSYNTAATSVDYCRTDSSVSDTYLGREEDYGSSSGSGEDHLQTADVEQAHWLNFSPVSQTGDVRWRGGADAGSALQRSPISINSRTCTQKLDSFSDAFLSQRKGRFPLVPSGDSSGQIWEFGLGKGENLGLVNSRHSCAFDSDSYLPPPAASPTHLSSFPSPPTSSYLMSSVLSPPPTPLPPPSHSPTKMDSPGAFAGSAYSPSQGRETTGALQFFSPRPQPLPSVHSCGVIWKLPQLSHCVPQSSDDLSSFEGSLRSSHGSEYHNNTAYDDALQCPESSFLASSSHQSSLKPSRARCSSNAPSLHRSCVLPSYPSHLSAQQSGAAENIAPHMGSQKVWSAPASRGQPPRKRQSSVIYTGTPFPSILHHGRVMRRGRYTPRPLLNPVRRGTGLYSSLSSVHPTQEETASGGEEQECGVLSWVNVGKDFQAELPQCFVGDGASKVSSPDEEPQREQLLWKLWGELEESTILQDQVAKLLLMCSSSCLPGGGSNTELALHCLHYCQGNIMATLEMLLLTQPSPTGDYHYSGSDLWTNSEKSLFSAALGTYGKDFSHIQKRVQTKTVCQCVEFYYLSKKLLDKQKKLKEEEHRDGEMEQRKSTTPICQPVNRKFGLQEVVPAPSLVSFFPCKLCGKMFYKIKSRNAHMKIHRQSQEDWSDRRLQLFTQRFALGCPTNLTPTPGSNLLQPQAPALTFPRPSKPRTSINNADNGHSSATNNIITPSNSSVLDPSTLAAYGNILAPNSHLNTSIGDSKQSEPTTVFRQSWGSFGHSPDPAPFYCNPEGKDIVGAEIRGVKEPIPWQ